MRRSKKESDGTTATKLELGSLIRAVADQLRSAVAGEDQSPVLELRDCEIELGITAEKTGGGGLKIYAFTLGGEIKKEEVSSVRVRFGAVRDPLTGSGPMYLISPTDARIPSD